MAYSYDPSDDYLQWDGTEAVTVYVRTGGGKEPISVSVAFRENVSRAKAASSGLQIEGQAVRWSIPVALLDGHELHAGDQIEDADEVLYEIGPLDKVMAGSRPSHYECLTQIVPG